jgi:DNA-binding PadR family transcriptional regulator
MKSKLSERERQLMLLLLQERTGREVAREFRREHGSPISYGTLYTTLRRLNEAGFVDVTREDEDADGRFRYYRLTGAGSKALSAAIDAMRNDAARATARLRTVS